MTSTPVPYTEAKVAEYGNTLFYYLSQHLLASALGKEAHAPEAVSDIWELLRTLPEPNPSDWEKLAKGQLAVAPKKKVTNGKAVSNGDSGDGKRHRGQAMHWTEEQSGELIKLMEDEAYRSVTLGKDAHRAGSINLAALARHFGASSGARVKIQYQLLKGDASAGNKPGSATKKAKTEVDPSPAATPAAVQPLSPSEPAITPGIAWTASQDAELQRLVREEPYRKEVLGKKHLKWSRLAEHFGHSKKSTKRRFTALTGEVVSD